MEKDSTYLLVFQCSECMRILFSQNQKKEDISTDFYIIDGQSKYKIELPFHSNILIQQVFSQNNSFLLQVICPFCKSFIAYIQLINSQMFILQDKNLIALSFDCQTKIDQNDLDDTFETILSVENQIKFDLEQNITENTNLILNPYLEYMNFSKKIEKFLIKERNDYDKIETSLNQLENQSEFCIQITEDLVKQAYNQRQKNTCLNILEKI
ncbi:hypothetical protein ABPG72_010407 [Tetrahymena utriculariae]